MLDRQERRAPAAPTGIAGLDDQELASRLGLIRERERIAAMDPEDIEISDLDPAARSAQPLKPH